MAIRAQLCIHLMIPLVARHGYCKRYGAEQMRLAAVVFLLVFWAGVTQLRGCA